nr:MAG TPA: hypothetical protein [Caudoviricetes sp.]
MNLFANSVYCFLVSLIFKYFIICSDLIYASFIFITSTYIVAHYVNFVCRTVSIL